MCICTSTITPFETSLGESMISTWQEWEGGVIDFHFDEDFADGSARPAVAPYHGRDACSTGEEVNGRDARSTVLNVLFLSGGGTWRGYCYFARRDEDRTSQPTPYAP